MMRRLVVLSRYSRMGASSRMRTMIQAPYLRAAGLEPDYLSLFEDADLLRLYQGGRAWPDALRALGRRVGHLRAARGADLIWIEKEALPWLPWLIEAALLPKDVPLAVDYDDAVFHRYDLHRLLPVRMMLGRKLDHLMARAALVTAGNGYLAERARQAGAARVEIVPTVVDLDAYPLRPAGAARGAARIGWIGSPSTWREYMQPRLPLMLDVAARWGARISIIGAGGAAAVHPLIESHDWSEESEAARIREMDVGIMPLTDTPWARGKCGYKLIQYMACGVPVVASDVGVNGAIVDHGVNGFLVRSDAEWRQALDMLLADPALRARMGQAGRRRIESDYSLQVWGPRVAGLLAGVAGQGPP